MAFEKNSVPTAEIFHLLFFSLTIKQLLKLPMQLEVQSPSFKKVKQVNIH